MRQAWDDHADQPQAVADRLDACTADLATPQQCTACAHLTAHVWGEHLGQWQSGMQRLQALGQHSALGQDPGARALIARLQASLGVAAGDTRAADDLSSEDRIAAWSLAASALAGQGLLDASITCYQSAQTWAEAGVADGSPALRALAIGGNNLAAALEERVGRSPAQTEAMVQAAQAGLRWWRRAGSWLEEERAEYRLARSLLKAGQPQLAQQAAQRLLAVCEAHQAPAFERFFGHAVLALAWQADGDEARFRAARQQALDQLAQVPEAERSWCAADLAELQA